MTTQSDHRILQASARASKSGKGAKGTFGHIHVGNSFSTSTPPRRCRLSFKQDLPVRQNP